MDRESIGSVETPNVEAIQMIDERIAEIEQAVEQAKNERIEADNNYKLAVQAGGTYIDSMTFNASKIADEKRHELEINLAFMRKLRVTLS